jgi:hypothetical protein
MANDVIAELTSCQTVSAAAPTASAMTQHATPIPASGFGGWMS